MYNPSQILSNTLRDLLAEGLEIPAPLVEHFEAVDSLKADIANAAKGRPFDAAVTAAKAGKLTNKMIGPIDDQATTTKVLKAALNDTERGFRLALEGQNEAIIDEVRAKIFNPAAAQLEALSEVVSEDDTVDGLVRTGRQDDAALLVASEPAAKEVVRALRLAESLDDSRRRYSTHTRYRNPEAAAPLMQRGTIDKLSSFIAAIRAGAGLYLPTSAQLGGAVAAEHVEDQRVRAVTSDAWGPAPSFFHNA